MDKGLLPRRYAKALYKYALEQNETTLIYDMMRRLDEAFSSTRELQTTIANPFVSESEKIALMMSAAGEDNATLANFVKLLARNNRLDIMREATLAYVALYRKENNIHEVTITSAAPLNTQDKERITSMIENHIGDATAEYNFNVNPDLIGGFVVRIDNESLDASVRNELEQMRQKLIK